MSKKFQWSLVVLIVLLVTILPLVVGKVTNSTLLPNDTEVITQANDTKEMNESSSGLMLPGIDNRQVSDALIGVICIAFLISTTLHFDRLAKRHRERMYRLKKHEGRNRNFEAKDC